MLTCTLIFTVMLSYFLCVIILIFSPKNISRSEKRHYVEPKLIMNESDFNFYTFEHYLKLYQSIGI